MNKTDVFVLLSFNTNVDRLQQFRWASHICVCICICIHSQVQSQRSNWDHICCWTSPSFLPILYGVSIDWSIYQAHKMSVIRSAGSSRVFIILGLGTLKALCLGLLWLWITLLELILVITMPIFFYIFTNWSFWSPSALLCFGIAIVLGVGCSWAWGSIFMGGFEIVAVAVLLVGGIGQSFLNLKRFSDIFPALGHGCQHELVYFWVVGGLYSEVPSCEGVWPSEFVGAIGDVRGCCAVALQELGLATTFILYFFVGMSLFLFSVAFVSFLTQRLALGWVGLDGLDWGWGIGPNFPSKSR